MSEVIIEQALLKLGSLKKARRLETAIKNHPSRLTIIGVEVPDVKRTMFKVKEKTLNYTPQEKIELCKSFVGSKYFELHQIAYYFLEKEKKLNKQLNRQDVIDLQGILDNWVLVDTYSSYILGVAWRNGVIEDSYIHNLLSSEDVWLRRCAVVSTIALNQKSRGGKGDIERTIAICKKVVPDHHDMIVKALSWALRVLTRVDKIVVEGFITEYEEKLHKRVIREVKNKLLTGLKN